MVIIGMGIVRIFVSRYIAIRSVHITIYYAAISAKVGHCDLFWFHSIKLNYKFWAAYA